MIHNIYLYIVICIIIIILCVYLHNKYFLWKLALSNNRYILSTEKYNLGKLYNIPRIIWMFWDKGFDNCPLICKYCVKSWKHYNPDWEVRILDNNSIYNYIDPSLINKIKQKVNRDILHIAGFSDFIRICLLAKYGGVWADITTFCNKPLNEWINHTGQYGFFSPIYLWRIPFIPKYISSWFIIAPKNSLLCTQIRDEFIKFILHSEKKVHYFSFHFCINKLVTSDEKIKNIWSKIPFMNTRYPHLFFYYSYSKDWKLDIDNHNTPLYKLTYKIKNHMNDPFIRYLLQKINI